MSQKYFYPLPKDSIEKYAREIFEPIKLGECVTTVWVGSAGRRTVTKFIIENIELFKDILPKPLSYLLVYVEPLDLMEENLRGYLRLIASSFLEACRKRKKCRGLIDESQAKVFEEERVSYTRLLGALRTCLNRVIVAGFEVVLFLGEFDELGFISPVFCNNLKSLWNHFEGKLHYVFLIKDVRMVFGTDKIGEELAEAFLVNVVYVPILKQHADYLIGRFEERIGYKLTEEEREVAKEMCGGHPYFLKVTCNILAKEKKRKKLSREELVELLRGNYELRSVARRIINAQTDGARALLKEIATGQVSSLPSEETKELELLGLIEKDQDGYYRPFCQLLLEAILKRAMPTPSLTGAPRKLLFDPEARALLWGGEPIDEKFSRQEYEVLTYLLRKPNKLITRDDIGEVLWGESSYEKYSDWAIDQLMSKLRKKLEKLGVGKHVLVTVRGRGYKFKG